MHAALARRPIARSLVVLVISLFLASIVWSGEWAGEVADELLMLGLFTFTFIVLGPDFRWMRPAYAVALVGGSLQLAYAVAGADEPRAIILLPLAAVPVGYVCWRRSRSGRMTD